MTPHPLPTKHTTACVYTQVPLTTLQCGFEIPTTKGKSQSAVRPKMAQLQLSQKKSKSQKAKNGRKSKIPSLQKQQSKTELSF